MILKFKIWEKFSKKFWNEGRGVSLAGLATTWRDCVLDKEFYELIPFTGCKDSKDKEIYEGDFLKLKNGVKMAVEFKNGAYQVFGNPLSVYYNMDGKVDNLFFEVEGNIYEDNS